MKFSVIMPVYNTEKYLAQSIETVLNQTYRNYELILVNDGSTDKSGDICERYKEENKGIIKVIHKKNNGQLMARCSGIDVATGDYCIFLDSDDMLVSECLEILYGAIERHSEPDLVMYPFFYLHGSKNCDKSVLPLKKDEKYTEKNKEEVYKALFQSTALNSMCTKATKTKILKGNQDKFEKYSALRCSEDRLQCMSIISKAKSIVCLDEALYYYRIVEGSVTRSFSLSTIERFNTKILCRIEESFLELWGLNNEEFYKKLEASFLNSTMYTFLNYYNNVKNWAERRNLVRYDWASFVEKEYLDRLETNEYVSIVYKKMWRYIIKKKYFLLEIYLVFRNFYKLLRNWKRKLMG